MNRARRLLDGAPESPTHGYLAYLDAAVAVAQRGSRRARGPGAGAARHLWACSTIPAVTALCRRGRGAGRDRRRQDDRSVRAARRGDAAGAGRPGADRMGRRHLLHRCCTTATGWPICPGCGRGRSRWSGGATISPRRPPTAGSATCTGCNCSPPPTTTAGSRTVWPRRAGRWRMSTAGRPARVTTNSVRFAGCSAMPRVRSLRSREPGSWAPIRSPVRRCCAAAWTITTPRGPICGSRWRGRTDSAACGCCAPPSRWRLPADDLDEAERHCDELESGAEAFGTPGFRAWAAHARGAMLAQQGRHAESLDALQAALREYRTQQSRYETAQVYEWMAVAHKALGDDDAGRRRRCHRGEHLRPTRRRAGTSLRPGLARRPDAARDRDPPAHRRRRHQQASRRADLHQREDRRQAPGQHLRQTRRLVAHRGSGVGARKQLAVTSLCIICTTSRPGICMVCPMRPKPPAA